MISKDALNENLDRKTILDHLGHSMFSTNIILCGTIDSTNRLLKELALKGAPEGTLVSAEEQTAGKGRMDRRWLSPGSKNLLLSILLRPAFSADQLFILTMILAIAVIDEVKRASGIEGQIKWPNDIYVNMKKLGGILSEFSIRKGKVEYIILGLGLNVNWNPGSQEGMLYPATSIFQETDRKISRNDLLASILKRFEGFYSAVLTGDIDHLYERWNDLSTILGREVTVDSPEERIKGKAIRIDRQGALVISVNGGQEQKILSGDVSVKF